MTVKRALYRLLLLAYPRDFRRWAGREMERAFNDRLLEYCRKGGRANLRLWSRTLTDVAANSLAERWISLRGSSVLSPPPTRKKGVRNMLNSLWQDIRYAFRLFRKNPLFALVAVSSLAFGIGVNSAAFSLVDAALLRQLPVEAPERLVLVRYEVSRLPPRVSHNGWIQPTPDGLRSSTSLPYPFFQGFREANRSLQSMFVFAQIYQLNLGIGEAAEMSDGLAVDGGYFSGLGVPAAIGRLIGPGDDQRSVESIAVLSDGLWKRRFGGDPGVVGETIRLNGKPFVVAGVAPVGFHGTLQVGESPALYIPLAKYEEISPSDRLDDPTYWWLHAMGRLKSEVTRETAQAELDAAFLGLLRQHWPEYVDEQEGRLRIRLVSGSQGMIERRGWMETPLIITLCIGAAVLLIACANLANLMLARGFARRGELALRLSLGALRGRLVRQLLTESFLLSSVGAGIGLLLAYWGGGILESLLPRDPGQVLVLETLVNGRVLLATLGLAALTALAFGLAPALMVSRFQTLPALKGSNLGSERQRSLPARMLIVAQVALSLALLVFAGLLGRTLINLNRVELGFNPSNLLVFRIDPTLNGFQGEALASLYERLGERFEAIPGIEAATLSPFSLISGSGSWSDLSVSGHPLPEDEGIRAHVHSVASNFLKTMEVSILQGRDLQESDRSPASAVAVVNEAFARQIEPSGSALGRHFGFGRNDSQVEIVGISRDAKNDSVRGEIIPTVFLHYSQRSRLRGMSYSLRYRGGTPDILASVRQAVSELDPNLPLFEVRTMSQQIDSSLEQERQFARITALFGAAGLVLACLGLYGVLSNAVGRRRREFGVRMALGASRTDVTRLVMREMTLVGVGIALGLLAAWAGSQWVESFLYGLSALDPSTLTLASLVMLSVAALAAYLPARRASRLDPVKALRYE